MSDVWILTQDGGLYADRFMSIHGVFTTPDTAKAWLVGHCERIAKEHPSNAKYLNRTDWGWSEEDGEWTCRVKGAGYGLTSWTIARYTVDVSSDS